MIVKLLSSNSYRKMQSCIIVKVQNVLQSKILQPSQNILTLKATPATKCLMVCKINFSAFTPVCRTLIAYISYGKVSTRPNTIHKLNLKSILDFFYLIGGLQPYNFAWLRFGGLLFLKSNKTWNNNVRIIRAPSFPEFMA